MDLDDFLGPKPLVVDLRAEDRWQAIEELLDHLVETEKIKEEHRNAIAESVKQRESSMSTAIGFGIGLPHAVSNLVPDVVTVIGRSRKGIQFDAPDHKPVHLTALFLVPSGKFQSHVNTLATLAKLLHRADFCDGFLGRFM